MPLKHLASADPSVIQAWFDVNETEKVDRYFPDRKMATNFRTKMMQVRRLFEKDRKEFFDQIEAMQLSVDIVGGAGEKLIYGISGKRSWTSAAGAGLTLSPVRPAPMTVEEREQKEADVQFGVAQREDDWVREPSARKPSDHPPSIPKHMWEEQCTPGMKKQLWTQWDINHEGEVVGGKYWTDKQEAEWKKY